MRIIFVLVLITSIGCAKEKPGPVYPERLPIAEQAKELTALPSYQPPLAGGKVVGVSEGDEVPFDGILLTEDKAMSAGELRTSYDEVYQLAQSNNKYLLSVVTIQEQELYRADKIIDKKNAEIKAARDSWWQQNKLSVGIATGVIIGVAMAMTAGRVWAEIEEEKVP